MSDQLNSMDDAAWNAYHGQGGPSAGGQQNDSWSGTGYTPNYSNIAADHNAGDQFYGWSPYKYNQSDFTSAQGARGFGPQSGRGMVQNVNGAVVDPSQQNQWRGQQQGLAGMLWQQANGQGPSVAGAQYAASADANAKQAMALMSSGRGAQNGGLASYFAGQQAGQGNMQAAQGAAIGRIQEQMGARSQLGDVLNQGRSQDIGLAEANAGFQQQAGLANAGAYNAQLGADMGAQNSWLAQELQNQQQAGMFNAGGRAQWAGMQGQQYDQLQQAMLQQYMQRNGYLYGLGSQNNQADNERRNGWTSPEGIGKIAGAVGNVAGAIP